MRRRLAGFGLAAGLLAQAHPGAAATPPKHAEALSSHTPTTLETVQVRAVRLAALPFELPASLSVAAVAPADAGQAGVNLSEVLVGIPGILARDRQNYTQDQQLSIRGFGARASFGVRGIRLYVDGIPATMPDGQGQVSHFNLDTAARVDVLRGPFSVLYGNASGGVLQLWSADGGRPAQTTLGVNAGSNDTFRYSANTRGIVGPVDYNIALSNFLTGGYRRHSRARRESGNAKIGIDLGARRKLTFVFNRMNTPAADDPLGLTKAQYRADPRQATAVATQYDTRKSARQNQLGAIYQAPSGDNNHWRLMAYLGQRDVQQFLSIPPGAQGNPLQAGGVIDLDGTYGGTDLRWTHDGQLAGRDYSFVLGASYDSQHQHRTGYENFVGDRLGVVGRLRRDEDNDVSGFDQYAQWHWQVAQRWSLLLGVRRNTVRFHERDRYVTASNPDDSGRVSYAATTPVAGVQYQAAPNLRIHASIGKGFETPSYNELGYRRDGQSGLAFDLRPAHSRHAELGMKWRVTRVLELDAALFRADTRDELAVASNQNGRSTYQNIGRTRRQGAEVSLAGELGRDWLLSAGITHLQARFRSSFLICGSAPCPIPDVPVAAGTRLPGVPDNYGSLRLAHGSAWGWRQGLTVSGVGAVSVNDTNTQRAAGYLLLGLDAGYTMKLGAATRLLLTARVDNLADRRHVGSVIVNDGNGRYFEPGPGRSYMLGARLTF